FLPGSCLYFSNNLPVLASFDLPSLDSYRNLYKTPLSNFSVNTMAATPWSDENTSMRSSYTIGADRRPGSDPFGGPTPTRGCPVTAAGRNTNISVTKRRVSLIGHPFISRAALHNMLDNPFREGARRRAVFVRVPGELPRDVVGHVQLLARPRAGGFFAFGE